jgi:hypothetical protein
MQQNSYSSLRPIQAGIPQGNLLGSTLFNINITDIPSAENDTNIAISVYADDTNINVLSGSIDIAVKKLNSAIDLLEPWFRKWRKGIIQKNAQLHCFPKRLYHYRRNTHPVKIFNENIAWTKETKYLGVTLDSKLTYRTHTSCILSKANYRLRQLFPISNKSATIDINLALVIYKSLLRSLLTYASPTWSYAASTYINKLQIFKKKILRIITKLPRVTPITTLHEQMSF